MASFWKSNTITPRITEMEAKMHARLHVLTEYTARDMESYARSHAPWKDRTGNARNGLRGITAIVPGKSYAVILAHGVSYGIWLEVRWSGKYAIIEPTLRHEIPKVEAQLANLLGAL